MKLYEITHEIRALFQTEELDIDALDALEMAFSDKVENTCAVIRECELEADGLKQEIDRLTNKKRALDNTAARLKDYIRQNMEANGDAKIKGRLFTVTLGKHSQIVNVTGDVPDEYNRITVAPDKTAITKALKSGVEFEHAVLVDGKAKLIIK